MHQHLVDFPLTNMHKNTLEKHCRFRNEEAATHLFKIASWLFVEHSCEKKKPSQVKRNLRNQTYLKKYNRYSICQKIVLFSMIFPQIVSLSVLFVVVVIYVACVFCCFSGGRVHIKPKATSSAVRVQCKATHTQWWNMWI